MTQTVPAPVPPSPPLPVSLATARQIEKIKARHLEITAQQKNPLGGSATAAALAKVPLRPAQKMMIWANPEAGVNNASPANGNTKTQSAATTDHSIQAQHREALLKWMNQRLKESHLEMGKVTAGLTTGFQIALPGLFLAGEAALVTKALGGKGISLVTDVPSTTQTVATDIAAFIGQTAAETDVTDIMDTLGVIPIVGAIFNVVKAAGLTTFLIMTQWEKVKSQRQLRSSWSVIEQTGLEAVIRCDNTDLKEKGAALAKSLVSMASAATGVGSLVTLPISAVTFVVKYVLLVKEVYDAEAANKKIAAGTIDGALLEKHPVLGLTLPHLHGVDALSIMGILPLGWLPSHPGLARLKQQAKREENKWMFQALNRMNVFNRNLDAENGLWRDDFQRVARLMRVTNYHLYEQRFLLVDKDGKLLYQAPPITRWQELKEFIKKKIMGTKSQAEATKVGSELQETAQSADPQQERAELEREIDDNGGSGATLLAERTQQKFHAMAQAISDEPPDPSARGPIAKLIYVTPAPEESDDSMDGSSAPLPQPTAQSNLPSSPPLPAAAVVAAYIEDDTEDDTEDDDIETIYA